MNKLIAFAIDKIMIIDGVTIPKVAKIAPITPASLYPVKVETLTAIIPGVHCPI